MRSLIKVHLTVFTTILLLVLLSYFGLAERSVHSDEKIIIIKQEETGSVVSQMIPVYFGLRENNEISPELPPEGETDLVVSCPKKFVPARWSILGKFGRYEYVDVGTWELESVNKALQAEGGVRFRMWVGFSGTGTHTGLFEFNWRRNEENIAQSEMNIEFQKDMQPKMVEGSANLVNQTPFQVGDVFSLHIRCKNEFDGAQLLFGSREHNSAVVMRCDPIDIIKVTGTDQGVKGIYNDVFRVNPGTMTFVARVDEIAINAVPTLDSEVVNNINYQSVHWGNKLEPGTYSVEVGISYMGPDNETLVTFLQDVIIKPKAIPTLLGIPLWIAQLIFGLIALIIAAVVISKIRSHYQEKKWMKEMGYQ